MLKHALVFLITFIAGATIALTVRARLHDPHEPATTPETTATSTIAGPASAPQKPTHSHAAQAAETQVPSGTVVNTICAICGMTVDPTIPPAPYKGRLVGFGCGACPARFAKDPDRYGPAALENRVAN